MEQLKEYHKTYLVKTIDERLTKLRQASSEHPAAHLYGSSYQG